MFGLPEAGGATGAVGAAGGGAAAAACAFGVEAGFLEPPPQPANEAANMKKIPIVLLMSPKTPTVRPRSR